MRLTGSGGAMFDALARLASGHPRRVLGIAVVVAILAGAIGGNVADGLSPYGAEDPSTESIRGDRRVETATGLDPGSGLVALVEAGGGPAARSSRERVARVAAALRRDPAVGRVTTSYQLRDRSLVSRDGRSQLVAVDLRAAPERLQQEAAERLGEELNGDGVKLGGFAPRRAPT